MISAWRKKDYTKELKIGEIEKEETKKINEKKPRRLIIKRNEMVWIRRKIIMQWCDDKITKRMEINTETKWKYGNNKEKKLKVRNNKKMNLNWRNRNK